MLAKLGNTRTLAVANPTCPLASSARSGLPLNECKHDYAFMSQQYKRLLNNNCAPFRSRWSLF